MATLYCIFTLVALCAVSAEALKCFVCDDCPLPDKSDVKTCFTPPIATNSTEVAPTNSSNTEPSTNTSNADPADTSEKRYVQDEPTSNVGCNCYDEMCDCSAIYGVLRADGNVTQSPPNFQCYRYIYEKDRYKVTERGCQEVPTGSNACKILGVSTGCYYCREDNCNSAFSMKISIASIVSFLCILLF